MERIDSKTFDEFAKRHTSMTGGILGIICVNGKIKRFAQEFPQTLTAESFENVLNEMRNAMLREFYDVRIIKP